ncbi:MAG TPA: hypothetical protein VFU88_07675 [Ktedonobacterales bacterium]|nr:hypothetical protein [Ktedonobacterales bacterium]
MDDETRQDVDELSGEYAALHDPRQVMPEVVAVVDELHRAITQLGNAVAAAGLAARDWRSPDAQLHSLSDQLPGVTFDDLITRAAEFAAGTGPFWLHGGPEEIEQFIVEVELLNDAFRPLRVIAQRQRVVPASERGEQPFLRALGDGRVGSNLDRITRCLNDLEALAPFMAPLAPDEWQASAPGDLGPDLDPDASPDQFTQPLPPDLRPAGPAPANILAPAFVPAPSLPFAATVPAPPPGHRGIVTGDAPSLPSAVGVASGRALASLRLIPGRVVQPALAAARAQWGRVQSSRFTLGRLSFGGSGARRALVVVAAIVLLAGGTGVLALAVHSAAPASTASLVVSPTRLTLACTGKSASTRLTLRWAGSKATTWNVKAPAGLSIAPAKGTLKAGASATVAIKVTARKAAHGTLTFAVDDAQAAVPYTVNCG